MSRPFFENLFGKPSRNQRRTEQKKATAKPQMTELEDRITPATFYVSTSGDDTTLDGTNVASPYRSIQTAVNAAGALAGADEIRVAAGIYNTPGFDNAISIGVSNSDGLQLLGGFNAAFTTQTAGDSVFIGQSSSPLGVDSNDVDIFASNVKIDGFTFVFDGQLGDGGTRLNGGLLIRTPNVVISNNTLEPSARTTGSGARPPAITTAFGNPDYSGLMITGNTINSNAVGGVFANVSAGIVINPDTTTTRTTPIIVSGNTITGDNLGSAIVVDALSNVTVAENTIARTNNISLSLIDIRQQNGGMSRRPADAPDGPGQYRRRVAPGQLG